MNVDMRDFLSGAPADIRADIEAADARVGVENADAAFSQQGVDRAQLTLGEIEVVYDMASRNNERVQAHDGKFVPYGEGQIVLRDDGAGMDFAKRANFDRHEKRRIAVVAGENCNMT